MSDGGVIYNDIRYKQRRKDLRNGMTKAEIELWSHLKSRALEGRKFRRQYGVGHYVLDFYCPEERLAVELDGPVHDEESARAYDRERDDFLRGLDIAVLRFKNSDNFDSLGSVLERIVEAFHKKPHS